MLGESGAELVRRVMVGSVALSVCVAALDDELMEWLHACYLFCEGLKGDVSPLSFRVIFLPPFS